MPNELEVRSTAFAVAVYRAWRRELRSVETKHVASQVIRASSSAADNYRSSQLGRSRPEFVARLGIVRDESSEAVFWLEYAKRLELGPVQGRQQLLAEARELKAIFVAAYRTAKSREE